MDPQLVVIPFFDDFMDWLVRNSLANHPVCIIVASEGLVFGTARVEHLNRPSLGRLCGAKK